MQEGKKEQIGCPGPRDGGPLPQRRQKSKGVRHCCLGPGPSGRPRTRTGQGSGGGGSGRAQTTRRDVEVGPGEGGAGPGRTSLVTAPEALRENRALGGVSSPIPERLGGASSAPPPLGTATVGGQLRGHHPPGVLLVPRPPLGVGGGSLGQGEGPEARPRLTVTGEPGGARRGGACILEHPRGGRWGRGFTDGDGEER